MSWMQQVRIDTDTVVYAYTTTRTMTHFSGICRLFSFISKEDMCQRLKRIESGFIDSIGDEARHFTRFHLHQSIKTDLYHFPLSPNYYIKSNQDGKNEYIHHSTYENTVQVYSRCSQCVEFVRRKRKTLKTSVQRASGRGVAPFNSLMEFIVNSNTTCALTGIRGSWSSFPGSPMYLLSLGHKIPLRAGGSSHIDNLQVALQCFNNVKGDYSTEDFKRWFAAIKQVSRV